MSSTATIPIERLVRAVGRTADYVGDRPRRGVSHDDADPELGTIECDDAIGFDPLPLLAALSRRGAPVVVFGQVAAILHGSEELTGDLDLLWSGEERYAPRLAEAFADVAASLTDQDGAAIRLDVDAFALPKVLFSSLVVSGDCCTPRLPWGELDIRGIIDRALETTGHGLTIRYASIADLVTMRRASGRVRDLRRAVELDALAEEARPGPEFA